MKIIARIFVGIFLVFAFIGLLTTVLLSKGYGFIDHDSFFYWKEGDALREKIWIYQKGFDAAMRIRPIIITNTIERVVQNPVYPWHSMDPGICIPSPNILTNWITETNSLPEYGNNKIIILP